MLRLQFTLTQTAVTRWMAQNMTTDGVYLEGSGRSTFKFAAKQQIPSFTNLGSLGKIRNW